MEKERVFTPNLVEEYNKGKRRGDERKGGDDGRFTFSYKRWKDNKFTHNRSGTRVCV
jgi:hypothetical protein